MLFLTLFCVSKKIQKLIKKRAFFDTFLCLEKIQKLIDRYDCGEVIQEVSPEALAQKINTLCSKPERLAILKENCKKAAAVEHWDADKKVLAEVVGRVFI